MPISQGLTRSLIATYSLGAIRIVNPWFRAVRRRMNGDSPMNISTILKSKGRQVTTVAPSTTVMAVAQLLAEQRIGAVVVTGNDGQVRGIVSERDIVMAVAAGGAGRLEARADEIMTSNPRTCREADTIDHIMSEMTARRFRHFPVVENGALVGIVSIGDIVKLRIAEAEMETAAMRDYIVAR